MFIGKYNKSLLITYIGVAASMAGIYFAFHAQVNYAMICLIFAGICDLFDGIFARSCKRTEEEKQFGIEIDTLADIINFVAFPIVICYRLGLDRWYHVVIYIVYTLCGITRLGYFNMSAKSSDEKPASYYSGLPVTYAALIFPLGWLTSLYLSVGLFRLLYTIIMLFVALLFILNIKINKPRGPAYLFFALLSVVVSAIIIIWGN